MHIIAEITYKCPANCEFCPIKPIKKSKETMDLNKFMQALKLFTTLPHERRLLTISGGEPTIASNLRNFIDISHKLGFTVTVVTHCYNPNRLLEAKPDFVQISLDSVNSKLWHNALKVINYIKERKLKGFIRYTLTKENINDLYVLKSKLKALEVDIEIYAMPIRGNPELTPSKEDILRLLEEGVAKLPTRCPAGRGQFVLTPDMAVLDCIFHRKLLGKFKQFSVEELAEIVERGKKLKPYPCGEPYWWSECAVPSAEKD